MAISTEKLLTLSQFQTGLTASKNYTDKVVLAEETRAKAAEQANATAAATAQAAAEAAQGTANEAKSAAATAQAGVDTNKGDITAMKGRVDALEAGTYDDTEVRGLISGNADEIAAIKADYLKAADKTALESADTAMGNRVKAIEDDYLKAADKEELAADIKENSDAIAVLNGDDSVEGSVDYKVAMEVAKILNDNDASDIDTLEEIAAWIKNDTAGVGDLNARIADLETADGEQDGKIAELEEAVEGLHNYDDTALAGRVTALETADGQQDTKIAALEEAVEGLHNYDDTALAGRVTALENAGYITEADVQINVASDAEVTEVCTAVFGA